MQNVRTLGSRLLWAAVAALLAVGMAIGVTMMPAKAHADEAAVRATASGVMKFNWYIDGTQFSRGSCFLINDTTVLTAYHCTMFFENELGKYDFSGRDIRQMREACTYSVTINRDVTVGATLLNYSEDQDYAIFKLDQPITGYTPLTLRDSSTVQAAEKVWAAGFPASSEYNIITNYTANDVTFKSGAVNKPESDVEILVQTALDSRVYRGKFLQTDCPTASGDSGGPMVDENGYVIGVNVVGGNDSNGSQSYYFASAMDNIMTTLKALGIEYKANPDIPSPKPIDIEDYELSTTALKSTIQKAEALENQTDSLTTALEAATEALALKLENVTDEKEYKEKQAQIDDANKKLQQLVDEATKDVPSDTKQQSEQPEPEGPNVGLIVGIVIAAIAVIALIVVLAMRNRKKGATNTSASTVVSGAQPQAPAQQQSGAQPSGGSTAATWRTPGGDDTMATTVLGNDATETVILSQDAQGGTLTRMSTNEQIKINSTEFAIGRERSKVNYCLEGNSAISRVHARITVRDGKVYIVDERSTGGTYVNGVKCRPGREELLKSGDIITFADEKFKYSV